MSGKEEEKRKRKGKRKKIIQGVSINCVRTATCYTALKEVNFLYSIEVKLVQGPVWNQYSLICDGAHRHFNVYLLVLRSRYSMM